MNILNIVTQRYKNDKNGNSRLKVNFFLNGFGCNSLINKGKDIKNSKLLSTYTFNDLNADYYKKVIKHYNNDKDVKTLKIIKLEMD